ncbi:MAG: hypothetical protein K2F82_06260, partial [Muribaculaceae bacterium]|nr:hypothetical protein [Muribaculaceae bacterium]
MKTLLQEVTVTATKEKFYNKGDTLIYNAGAFMLPEGAMLDGLLEQMPGVKVQANGKITVNDNPVEGLLLNGKDVFNNNGQLMLENLGAYMVDDVAMYNKRNRDSELMGRSVGASPYVMDVRLKREYSQGLVVNAEGGYGTEDRYLGRLFGMSYSDNLALTVYGSANNLSDESTPGRNKDSSWTIADMGLGTVTRQQGGATYLVKDSDDWYELKGSVETINRIDDTRRLTSIEWYLQPTHIHEYRWLGQCERQFNVKTKHDWFFKFGDKANLTVTPLFRFDRNKRNSESMSVTMTEKLERVTHDGIAAIYSTDDSLKDKVLNRLKEEQTKEGTMLLARIEASSSIKLYDGDRSGGMLKLICWAGWNDSKNDRFDRYRLAYGDSAMSDMQHHRYYKQYPNYEKSLFGEVQYVQFTSFLNMQIPVTYNFQTTKRRNTVDMYALDRIPGYDPTDSGLDCLPSRDDYLSVLDPWESCMVEEVS